MRRQVEIWAAGATLLTSEVEPDLADAMFLHRHPGWAPRDLYEAPDEIVAYIRMIDAALDRRVNGG